MGPSLFIGGSTSGRSGDSRPVGSLVLCRRSLIRLVGILIALLVFSSLPAAAAGPDALRPRTVLAAGLVPRAHGLYDALASRYSGEAMGSSRNASDGPGRGRPATSRRPNLTLTVRDSRATRMAPLAANYNLWNFNYDDADRVTTHRSTVATKSAPGVAGRGGIGPVLKGQAGVDRVIAEIEASGGKVLGQEITVDAGGVRTRPDLFVEDAAGNRFFVEVKNGPSAGLTPNQKAAFPTIESSGGVPAGKNAAAAGLKPGTPIGPTPVVVRRLP